MFYYVTGILRERRRAEVQKETKITLRERELTFRSPADALRFQHGYYKLAERLVRKEEVRECSENS
jgi:hypothetical protein